MSDLSQHDPFYIGSLFGSNTKTPERGWSGGVLSSTTDTAILSALNTLTTPPQPILNFNNPITSDGTYTISTNKGREYGIEFSGNFGGGTINLVSENDTLIYQFTEPNSRSVLAITDTLEIIVSGSVAPNIEVDITPVFS